MYKNIFSLLIIILSLTSIKIHAMDLWREDFYQAIKTDDLAKVQKLMPQNDTIDSPDNHGETPLLLAAAFGRLKIMLEILKSQHCSDVDRTSDSTQIKRRPLHYVCSSNEKNKPLQLEVTQKLISNFIPGLKAGAFKLKTY